MSADIRGRTPTSALGGKLFAAAAAGLDWVGAAVLFGMPRFEDANDAHRCCRKGRLLAACRCDSFKGRGLRNLRVGRKNDIVRALGLMRPGHLSCVRSSSGGSGCLNAKANCKCVDVAAKKVAIRCRFRIGTGCPTSLRNTDIN